MPPARRSPLDRFVGRVHRRYVVLRAAERAGLGMLGGCGAALLLLPLLWWQGRSALGPSVAAAVGGLGLGLLWGLTRRPRRIDAAMEADRQLGLHDLLGTALTIRGPRAGSAHPPDPWEQSVVAMAEARCRGLSPAAVVLNRLGARAWGGIGLAAAMVLTLAFLAGAPAGSQAAADRPSAFPEAGALPGEVPEHPLLAAPALTRPPPLPGRDNDSSDEHPGTSTSADAAGNDVTPETTSRTDPSARASTAGEPTGGSSGSSRTRPPVRPTGMPEPTAPAGGGRPSPADGATSAGAGRATDPARAGPAAAGPAGRQGSAAGTAAPPRQTPPWQTDQWPADAQRAREALDAGRVPPAYRDMVRQYFDRR